MSDELKPCPFCGGKPTFVHATSEDIGNGYVCRTLAVISCDHCMFDMAGETDEDAAAAWNDRAAVTDGQFAMAVHNGEAWQAVRECKLEECEWGNGQCTWGCRCTACGDKFEHTSGITWNFCPNCGAKVAG